MNNKSEAGNILKSKDGRTSLGKVLNKSLTEKKETTDVRCIECNTLNHLDIHFRGDTFSCIFCEETVDTRLSRQSWLAEQEEAEQTYTIINGQLAMRVMGKRIMILEDKFKTGLECKTCDGNCFSDEDCHICKGTKLVGTGDATQNCRTCMVDNIATGKKLCSDCNGKGALIIAPQTAERRTTSGKVTSVGPECTLYKVGDHVIYGSYAGTDIKFKQKVTIRIMHEDEVLAKLFASKDFNFGKAL